MATATTSRGPDLSELQREMAQIRHDMHQEVQGAVQGAQSLTDWRKIVARHPWAALGIAAGVGYLIVPRRRRSEPSQLAAPLVRAELPTRTHARPSVMRTAFSLLTPVLTRAAQNYALGQLERWLATNAFAFQEYAAARPGQPAQAAPTDPNVSASTIPFRDRQRRP